MPRANLAETLRKEIADLIANFENELIKGSLRSRVLALIPVFKNLRNLGKSLIPEQYNASARDRILTYFRTHTGMVIEGDELLVISGIQDYPRRIRELRVQFGWSIASGVTIKEMRDQESLNGISSLDSMKPDQYILLTDKDDRDAAYRWNTANAIRREKLSISDKILKYLKANVGRTVTGEELRYVAGNKTEWARRVRELRTEHGWQIVSKMTGRPDLPVGVYVLETDKQGEEHDRKISDKVRQEVFLRDNFKCRICGWTQDQWTKQDPRHWELHHIKAHVNKGSNDAKNLKLLCNKCHDKEHKKEK